MVWKHLWSAFFDAHLTYVFILLSLACKLENVFVSIRSGLAVRQSQQQQKVPLLKQTQVQV